MKTKNINSYQTMKRLLSLLLIPLCGFLFPVVYNIIWNYSHADLEGGLANTFFLVPVILLILVSTYTLSRPSRKQHRSHAY